MHTQKYRDEKSQRRDLKLEVKKIGRIILRKTALDSAAWRDAQADLCLSET
jgi:hypothetical protein